MSSMPSVSAMHEKMHERAGKKQEIGQNAKQMRLVFGQQVKQGNRGEKPPAPLHTPFIALIVAFLGVLFSTGLISHDSFLFPVWFS